MQYSAKAQKGNFTNSSTQALDEGIVNKYLRVLRLSQRYCWGFRSRFESSPYIRLKFLEILCVEHTER